MKLFSRVNQVRGLRRIGTIGRVLVKHGFADLNERLFRRSAAESAPDPGPADIRQGYFSPVRIRQVLEELGPSFIKLGQLMSTRADLFPPTYIKEFRKLQDRVTPIDYDAVKTVVETQLKAPIQTLFKSFDKKAIATASVAQVHRAVLPDGSQVAVKVIRPGIAKKVRADIRLMYAMAQRLENVFEMGRIIGFVNLVKEFERTIFRELDLLIEAGNMARFAANFKNNDEIYISEIHWNLSSKSVLTMEYVDGIKMDQIETMEANDIDPKEIAMIGLRAFSLQLMEFGLFHADPHPANVIVMYDGRVSLVDFGIIGYLDEETMMQIANIILGYAEHDYNMVIDAFIEAGIIEEERIDLNGFKIDLVDTSEPFYGRSLETISVKDVYDQIMGLVLKYRLKLPRNLMLLLKTFIQTEALGKLLGSDASILEVSRPYARELFMRGYNAQKLIRNFNRDARNMGGLMKKVPKYVHDILKAAATGQYALEIRHSGLKGLDAKIEKGINRMILGLVVSASLIAAALVLNATHSALQVMIPIFNGHTISLTTLLGLIGYTMATALGIWLVFSILRSGKS